MAPYCAIPRDYLSDTPLLRAMGFLVPQHGQLSAIPPPPLLSVSPVESMRSGGCDTPPQKGYLSDTGAIPYEKQGKWVRHPPLRYYLERVLRDRGGVSRTGPLREGSLILLTKGAELLESEVGEVFAPTRFSLVRISIRNLGLQREVLSKEFRRWGWGSKSDPHLVTSLAVTSFLCPTVKSPACKGQLTQSAFLSRVFLSSYL